MNHQPEAEPEQGRQRFEEAVKGVMRAVPDSQWTVSDLLADGESLRVVPPWAVPRRSWSTERDAVLLLDLQRLSGRSPALDFETGWGLTASGGECGEGRDQAVPLGLRHVAYDPGDFLAAVRGDRVHDVLPVRG